MKAEVESLKLPATLEVQVLRSFMSVDRKPTKVGDRVHLPRVFALEMKAANKVKIIEPAPEPKVPHEEPAPSGKGNGNGNGRGRRDAA